MKETRVEAVGMKKIEKGKRKGDRLDRKWQLWIANTKKGSQR